MPRLQIIGGQVRSDRPRESSRNRAFVALLQLDPAQHGAQVGTDDDHALMVLAAPSTDPSGPARWGWWSLRLATAQSASR